MSYILKVALILLNIFLALLDLIVSFWESLS
jgi:hypothetical protein